MLKIKSSDVAPRLLACYVLRARHEHNRRRNPCTMLQSSCGAVVRRFIAGPVGEGPISPTSA